MKRILDAAFQYRPSFATDLRKTFARARRAQRDEREARAQREAATLVVSIARGTRAAGR
jgi:hypothetical protein